MDFKVVQKEIELQSRGWIPTFHDISIDIHKIVEESGIQNGTVSVVSHHTTCSVMIQEKVMQDSATVLTATFKYISKRRQMTYSCVTETT